MELKGKQAPNTLAEHVVKACERARDEILDDTYPTELAAQIEGDCQDVEHALETGEWTPARLRVLAQLVYSLGHSDGLSAGVEMARGLA